MNACSKHLSSGICDAYGIGMNGKPCPCEGDFDKCNGWPKRITSDVAHQQHYEEMAVQPIEMWLALLTPEQMIGALMSQVIKYGKREGHKQSTDDVAKFHQYRKWLAEYRATGTLKQFSGKEEA